MCPHSACSLTRNGTAATLKGFSATGSQWDASARQTSLGLASGHFSSERRAPLQQAMRAAVRDEDVLNRRDARM